MTSLRKFVIGDLPEIVENEIDGDPIPTAVSLPVTINGRIFPREDVDRWTFEAAAGDVVSCEVAARRIGSPLDARLEAFGPDGGLVAENAAVPGPDAGLRFTARTSGRYEVRILDSEFRGSQHFVYRLTLTKGPVVDAVYPMGGRRNSSLDVHLYGANLPRDVVHVRLPNGPAGTFLLHPQFASQVLGDVALEVGDLPEFVEETAEPAPDGARRARLPAVLNGRILHPGEVDLWQVNAHRGETWRLDLEASRLGSMLDSVLTVLDSSGKKLASCDDMKPGQTDSQLTWKAPGDGTYEFRVEDRLPSRGGSEYAYRLHVDRVNLPTDFRLVLAGDTLNIERGKEARLKITVEPQGGFRGPIALSVDGLETGVTANCPKIGAGTNSADIVFKADQHAKVRVASVAVRGSAVVAGKTVVRTAVVPSERDDPPIDRVAVAVVIPTPFTFAATYDQAYTPRGSVYLKHYTVVRNGYSGPLEIRLADRQVRFRQGVTGPALIVPAGADAFDYPLKTPPFMEVLRTSRTNLMATGVVTDPDGERHQMIYVTDRQSEQMVSVVAPGRLTLTLDPASVLAAEGTQAVIHVHANRDQRLSGTVRVELAIPAHIAGVSADVLTVAAGTSEGDLKLSFSSGRLGPFNMPLAVRATIVDERGFPVVAEAPLSVSPAR